MNEFTEESKKEIAELLTHYPNNQQGKQAALLPVLFLAQDQFGWISEETMKLVAETLNLPPSHVFGVATFYSMFNKKQVGKHHIKVCRTLSCSIMGCGKIIDHLKNKLSIEEGETTKDGKFTLSTVECLASCGTGPMMQVNRTYHENLDEKKVDEILRKLT